MNGKLEQKNGYASEPVTLIVESPEAFKEVAHHFGALIPPHVAAKMAEVTNQRIQNLIRQGRFTRIVIYGAVNISQFEFEKWLSSPRQAGRPRRKQNISAPAVEVKELEGTPELPGEVPGNGYQAPTFLTPPET